MPLVLRLRNMGGYRQEIAALNPDARPVAISVTLLVLERMIPYANWLPALPRKDGIGLCALAVHLPSKIVRPGDGSLLGDPIPLSWTGRNRHSNRSDDDPFALGRVWLRRASDSLGN